MFINCFFASLLLKWKRSKITWVIFYCNKWGNFVQLFNEEDVGGTRNTKKRRREFYYNTVHRQLLFTLLDKKQLDEYLKSQSIYIQF